MATVDAIVDEAQLYGFTQIADATCIRLLNGVYHLVCGYHPWPFLEKVATLTVTSGTATIPSDMRQVLKIYNTTTARNLQRMTHEEFLAHTTESATAAATGESILYYTSGDLQSGNAFLRLWPTNSTSHTCQYIQIPADLVAAGAESTILIPPRHHDALIAGLTARLYLLDENFEKYGAWWNIFMERVELMENDLLSVALEETDAIRGRVTVRSIKNDGVNIDNPQ